MHLPLSTCWLRNPHGADIQSLLAKNWSKIIFYLWRKAFLVKFKEQGPEKGEIGDLLFKSMSSSLIFLLRQTSATSASIVMSGLILVRKMPNWSRLSAIASISFWLALVRLISRTKWIKNNRRLQMPKNVTNTYRKNHKLFLKFQKLFQSS